MSMPGRGALKVAFVGGGSYRILPILRAAFACGGVFDGGEVRLVDLNVARAEAVGRMIQRTPEFAPLGCKVAWGNRLDPALEGADALYVTMAVGDPLACALSERASMSRGFISSDQLSITGAFMALTAGPVILDFARRMEKRCPGALMLIFANPVAVYSGMVNNHTRVRALGLCGGFGNHRWDLTRLMGRDAYRDEYDVDVAGVNHLSFILRGTFRGQDLYAVLGRHLRKGWRPPPIGAPYRWLAPHIGFALRKLAEMYHRFGKIIFSTEGDGMAHLFYEEMFARAAAGYRPRTTAQLRAEARKNRVSRAEADRRFRRHLDMDLDESFWAQPPWKNPWFGRDERDIAVPIFRALAGRGTEKIVASAVHRGAVAGFKDRAVLEFSHYIDRRGPRAAGKYEVPDCFHGLITALATHQTLLGDAIATRDPKVLADALFAYPVKQNTRDSVALFREMLRIHAKYIPAEFEKAKDY
jgi:6-phospho-beta-glucosidase